MNVPTYNEPCLLSDDDSVVKSTIHDVLSEIDVLRSGLTIVAQQIAARALWVMRQPTWREHVRPGSRRMLDDILGMVAILRTLDVLIDPDIFPGALAHGLTRHSGLTLSEQARGYGVDVAGAQAVMEAAA